MRAKKAMAVSTLVPIPTNTVFLKNPTPRLLVALGKTENDCIPDQFGKENCRWLDLPDIPENIKIHRGYDSTFLLEEIEEETVEENTLPTVVPDILMKLKKRSMNKCKTWKRKLATK